MGVGRIDPNVQVSAECDLVLVRGDGLELHGGRGQPAGGLAFTDLRWLLLDGLLSLDELTELTVRHKPTIVSINELERVMSFADGDDRTITNLLA